MAKTLGSQLPEALFNYLDGSNIESKGGRVILTVSVDIEGWPHIAMLSHWEVVAKDKSNIRIGTYAGSRTTSNLRRDGRMTLIVVDERMAYYVKCEAQPLKELKDLSPPVSLFTVKVREVLDDHSPTVPILTGIRYNVAADMEAHREVFEELIRS